MDLDNKILSGLFHLLKVALGTETSYILPKEYDLALLLSIANRHNITPLVADGLSISRELFSKQFTIDDEDCYLKILGYQFLAEKNNGRQLKMAAKLADIFHEKGLATVVLKGFSIANLYPQPLHRNSCDLDCFLLPLNVDVSEEREMVGFQELGNQIVECLGVEVDRSYYRNSKFCFETLNVENHRYCAYPKGNTKKKDYEILLQGLLKEKRNYIFNSYLESPSPMFIALHTLSHMKGHFLSDGITLRHLFDWACVLNAFAHKGQSFWRLWQVYAKTYDLMRFGVAITGLANRYLNVTIPFDYNEDEHSEQLLLNDILDYGQRIGTLQGKKTRLTVANRIIANRWKYKLYSEESMLSSLTQRAWGYLFERHIKL